MKKKIKPKLKVYNILADNIAMSIEGGYQAAFKYTDTPDEDTFTRAIYNAIMLGLTEIIDFGDE